MTNLLSNREKHFTVWFVDMDINSYTRKKFFSTKFDFLRRSARTSGWKNVKIQE